MTDTVINLISYTRAQDADGVWRNSVETSRQVFATADSVTRYEFYNAGRNGLNPDLRFTVFSGDYEGEEIVEYDGKRYGVYRTYRVPGTDYMELYVERKGGTNGQKDGD